MDEDFFSKNTIHFTSKSESQYSYTEEGVYRYSNHWGRVANCRWKLYSKEKLNSQSYYLGYAKWTDFYGINENEKLFFISVDFELKTASFHHKQEKEASFLFSLSEAQKRIKQIRHLLKDEKWARHFNSNIEELRKRIITELISTDKSLRQIKLEDR